MLDTSVLRENDIRGVYGKNINEDVAFLVGAAFGTYLLNNNKTICVVGFDNRLSGESLVEHAIKGLVSTGINVTFIGMVTTAILNYATIHLNIEAGLMVTASHNPSEENGFKLFGNDFLHLSHEELEIVYNLIKTKDFKIGKGNIEYINVNSSYINMIDTYILKGKKRLRVAIDCGNGTTSLFIKTIINKFNIDPIYLNTKSDGSFPVHNPDPNNDENLRELKKVVVEKKCDYGVAYDGDGDRFGIVDELGNTIESDKLIAIFARNIIPKTLNKKVIMDVKCSNALEIDIKKLGAKPIMVKNGSAYIESVMKYEDVLIGGEYSGHIFFRDKFYGFDDGIYGGLRMYEILSNTDKLCSELLEGYKKYYNTPEIRINTTDNKKWNIINRIKDYVIAKGYDYIDIDGVRVVFEDGWALIRCSNTQPCLTSRYEAETESRLLSIKKEFEDLINKLL